MAVTIRLPDTAIEQPTRSIGLDSAGATTFQRVFKDLYETLETALNTISTGDFFDGKIITAANVTRTNGELGILTLTLAPNDTSDDEDDPVQNALSETWALKSVRNDMSILAYCGPSEGANPNRADIEAWMKEPDGSLAKEYKYKKADGSEVTISNQATKDVINKILAGKDTVMRFYPLLTKKRIYSREPASVFENLATINEPSVSAGSKSVKKPGNLAAIISKHEWLKCQDDVEEMTDGKFQRVESWMGVLKSERHWDADFYGENSWAMPLEKA